MFKSPPTFPENLRVGGTFQQSSSVTTHGKTRHHCKRVLALFPSSVSLQAGVGFVSKLSLFASGCWFCFQARSLCKRVLVLIPSSVFFQTGVGFVFKLGLFASGCWFCFQAQSLCKRVWFCFQVQSLCKRVLVLFSSAVSLQAGVGFVSKLGFRALWKQVLVLFPSSVSLQAGVGFVSKLGLCASGCWF